MDRYFDSVKRTLDALSRDEIANFRHVLTQARERGSHVFIMGNGGSAATASHYVCDFNKGISCDSKKPRFKFICLNDNAATLMAYANDTSYEEIFVGPLQNFMQKDDVVIGISGSGNSKNVLKAIDYANRNGGITVGITGYDGGKLRQTARHSVNANVNDMQVSEDIHMILDHMAYAIFHELEQA